jgi:hypothetical protein
MSRSLLTPKMVFAKMFQAALHSLDVQKGWTLQWNRLYRTLKAKLGWVIVVYGIFVGLADAWGRGQTIHEWFSHLPEFLQFLSQPWVASVAFILGFGLVAWGVVGRNAATFDNLRFLPKAYQKPFEIPHIYFVGAVMLIAVVLVGLKASVPQTKPRINALPPRPPTITMVTSDPLEMEAEQMAETLVGFVDGREAKGATLPTTATQEQAAAYIVYYEGRTVAMYMDVYEPRVAALRDKFAAQRHVTSNTLDNFYQSPQSSQGIRHVAEGLADLAMKSNKRAKSAPD